MVIPPLTISEKKVLYIMDIPTSYNKLTVRQFIEIKRIELACQNKEQVKAALITLFTNKPVSSIPLGEWKLLILKTELLLESYHEIKTTKPKDIIEVNGQKFYGITDATALCVNQYTAIKDLCADGQSDVNLNKIAGLIFYKVKGTDNPQFSDTDFGEIQETLLDAKVGDVGPTVFFYARVLERLNPLLPAYLELAQIEIEKQLREIMEETHGETLSKVMAGIIQ